MVCICFKDNIILAGGREIACLFLFSACLLSLMMVGEDEDMCCWDMCCWETCRWRVFTWGVYMVLCVWLCVWLCGVG